MGAGRPRTAARGDEVAKIAKKILDRLRAQGMIALPNGEPQPFGSIKNKLIKSRVARVKELL